MNRRRFLTNAGVMLWLPVLESLVPEQVFAAVNRRSKFVFVFTPSGMLMVNGDNGNWTFQGALKPLADRGLQGNSMIIRQVYSANPADPHWENTAGFLSCKNIALDAARPTVCGKTFDQYVADQNPTFMRSLHVGYKPMNRDFSADHGAYSDRYLDTLSFSADNRPIGNQYSPTALYESVFGVGAAGQRHVQKLNERRKSVIDLVIGELGGLQSRLSSADRPRLEAYLDGVRDIEKTISRNISSVPNCAPPATGRPGGGLAYQDHVRTMQRIVALAFQCGLISAATIMYDDGVGDQFLVHPGVTGDHHGYAHHGNNPENMARLNSINVLHGTMFAEFVEDMRTRGQLDSSLIMWGSNMSDGNTHNLNNLPIVVCGGGNDLRFGQEIVPAQAVPRANLFVALSEAYGLNMGTYGGGTLASNARPLVIKT